MRNGAPGGIRTPDPLLRTHRGGPKNFSYLQPQDLLITIRPVKGSVYQRGRIWWVAWYESVKAETGQIRRVQRHESSRSERRSDAVTLLNTRVYESRHQRPRPSGHDPAKLTYEE